MLFDCNEQEATPSARSACPHCRQTIIAKCGPIVSWHWAHLAADCDPWAAPESAWHLDWKRRLRDEAGAAVEVTMPPHRADAVLRDGAVIELQSDYLALDELVERHAFYGPHTQWVFRCHWESRMQFGRHGFWWKHGSKAMAQFYKRHMPVILWDMGQGDLWRVRLGLSDTGTRVLGKVLSQSSRQHTLAAWSRRQSRLEVAA
jgi:competence CoiA-like predicted nuclease